jgi:hypothetical protein
LLNPGCLCRSQCFHPLLLGRDVVVEEFYQRTLLPPMPLCRPTRLTRETGEETWGKKGGGEEMRPAAWMDLGG